MEEELDWGHEEDDYQPYDTRRSRENIGEPRHHPDEDCDDTVSLGGDEEDLGVVYAYQSRSYQEKSKTFEVSRHHNRDHHRESSHSSTRQPSHLSPPHSSHQHAKLMHALPAKPVATNPSVAVAQSQLLEASSMVNGRDRDRRNSIKKPTGEPLPPDWEIRHPRSGGTEVYYYNTRTHESTWALPTLTPPKGSRERNESANGTSHQSIVRSRARSPSHGHAPPPKSRTEPPPEDLSFDDRHYRPTEVPTPGSRVEHVLPQKPVFADRRSPERLSSAESSRHAHRSQAEPERARSRRGASPSNVRPPSPESRRQETGREPRSRSSRMDSYVPSTDRTHTSAHDERDTVRPSTNRRPASARDSPCGQETRSDYDSYIPMEEHPRSRRSHRSRSTSPRTSRVRDTGGEEAARYDVAARRRPRDPDADMGPNEVETKRRRLDDPREQDRLSPPSASQYPSAEKNEALYVVPIGESRHKRPPLPPQKNLYKESITSHGRDPPPAHLPETDRPPSRQNGHGPDPASRSRNPEPQPPSGPGARRGRAGDSRKLLRTDPMDIDPPAPVHPPRMQENRSASGATTDRDDTMGDLPRGPKAMKLPPAPSTSLPPKPIIVAGRYSGRSPPPHLITHDERPLQRTDDRSVADSHPDRRRDTPRDRRVPEVARPRRCSPEPRRHPNTPAPKLSGTNNVPIARSRYQPSTAPTSDGTDEHRQDPVLESKQPVLNASTRQTRHERNAASEHPQARISVHELPDRPPLYQGPPALERRESNRSRHEHVSEQPPDRRDFHNPRTENYPEGSGARRSQLPPGAKVIYERPSPPLSPQYERDSLEVLAEKRTKLESHHHSTAHSLPEGQPKPDRTERVRIDRERALRREEKQQTRHDVGDERRRRTDTPDHHVPLERRLSSYGRQSYSPNELPPPSPPFQTGNREDYDHHSTSGHDDRNYSRGPERIRTPSPSRHYGTPQQLRGPRRYDGGGDGRRPPARPRSPYSDVGEREYGKAEVRSAASSRGGSLLDRLSTDNRTGEREVMEDRFDDRGAITDTNPASNGRDATSERKDNSRRRRRIKGGRR